MLTQVQPRVLLLPHPSKRLIQIIGGSQSLGGDNITQIEVSLDASWAAAPEGNARTAGAKNITFTLAGVTAPAPSRLTFPPAVDADTQGAPVATYEFTMRSKGGGDGGVFRRLKPTAERTETQQTVMVGNVADGVGAAAITVSGNSDNKIYEGETDKNIEIVFTATGPMYDLDADRNPNVVGGDDIDAEITITIPNFLTAPHEGDGVDDEATDSRTDPGFIEVTRHPGVVFESSNNPLSVAGQVVTLHIKRVDTGGKIYVAYRKVAVITVPGLNVEDNRFVVATRTTTATGSPTELTDAGAAIEIPGGLGQALAGSGETEVSPEVVAIGTKVRTATFKYTARGCH